MSVPEGAPDDLGEMLDQAEWYRDTSGNWWRVEDMQGMFRAAAADRLLRFALPMAQAAFKDLYAYGYPSGQQAQIDLERGEAECEAIMADDESARRWMAQTPLYEALSGKEAPVVLEDAVEPEAPAYEAREAVRRTDVDRLNLEILRLEQVETQVGTTLKALRTLRDSLL